MHGSVRPYDAIPRDDEGLAALMGALRVVVSVAQSVALEAAGLLFLCAVLAVGIALLVTQPFTALITPLALCPDSCSDLTGCDIGIPCELHQDVQAFNDEFGENVVKDPGGLKACPDSVLAAPAAPFCFANAGCKPKVAAATMWQGSWGLGRAVVWASRNPWQCRPRILCSLCSRHSLCAPAPPTPSTVTGCARVFLLLSCLARH